MRNPEAGSQNLEPGTWNLESRATNNDQRQGDQRQGLTDFVKNSTKEGVGGW